MKGTQMTKYDKSIIIVLTSWMFGIAPLIILSITNLMNSHTDLGIAGVWFIMVIAIPSMIGLSIKFINNSKEKENINE
jgi:Na+-driven multidrug efflux pump